ncbi:hypothetical protein [Mesoterricola sediminis]|nr:hypothetical protein [Mesoterricola sediminis]
MYLFSALQDQGLNPQKGEGAGPDFSVLIEGRRYWIEAVAPGKGNGADQVPAMDFDCHEARLVPHAQIQLRYAASIADKAGKWPGWLEKGIVKEGDGFLIALNGFGCNEFMDATPPLFVRACLGIGHPTIAIDAKTLEVVDSFYAFSDSITKKSGEAVSTTPLLNPAFAHVSGVMHSLAFCGARRGSLLEGMEFLQNPLASIPFPGEAVAGFRRYSWSERGLTTINPEPAWDEDPDLEAE